MPDEQSQDPPPKQRYRCTACGNLTRFDVTILRRTQEFHHFTVGGELTVENKEVLDEQVEEVICRWCGVGFSIKEISGDPSMTPQPSD